MKISTHEQIIIRKHWYRSFNNKGDILFIHGFNSTYFSHVHFLEALYEEGYNLFTFDLPNHGVNVSHTEQFLFADYLKYIKQFIIDNKLKKIILIGHSMGGGLALALQNDKELKFMNVILLDPLQAGATKEKAKRVLSMVFNGINPLTFLDKWFNAKESNPTIDHWKL
jgi:alpha-beta hydrolase superfamily lysophospholipase